MGHFVMEMETSGGRVWAAYGLVASQRRAPQTTTPAARTHERTRTRKCANTSAHRFTHARVHGHTDARTRMCACARTSTHTNGVKPTRA